MDWTPLFPLTALEPGHLKAHHGVLVVRTADGALHAMENACPHQGYPLAQGTLSGGTLTCCWHNFKFDVTSGACVMGEEAVRTHPVRVVDGVVEVRRHVEVDVAAAWTSLAQAMARVQTGRIARDVARLLSAGVPPARLLAWGAAWDADRGEYGPSHTAALAGTLLGWLDAPVAGTDARAHPVQLVTEALDLAARAVVGLPLRVRPAAEAPGADAAAELRRRVEAEDAPGAEALVRGMVAAGWTRPALEAALYPLVADHFLDFGHMLIYVAKTLDLAEAADAADAGSASPATADALLGGLVYGIACGTREDTLPPWAGFRARWKAFAAADGPALAFAARNAAPLPPADRAALRAALADGTAAEAFTAAAAALTRGAWDDVLDALVLAGATRLARFDLAHDADPTVEEGWLDVTHRLTVASAVREAVSRWADPEVTRIVLAAVHFVAIARPLDGPAATLPPAPDAAELRAIALRDRSGRAIFFAHDVKTLAVAEAESARLGDPLPLQAVARFFAAPVRERPVQRLAHEAVRLVHDGKPPRTLSG